MYACCARTRSRLVAVTDASFMLNHSFSLPAPDTSTDSLPPRLPHDAPQ